MACPRCSKPATCIGHDDVGERYQCRFCTNEWYEQTVAAASMEGYVIKHLPDIDVDLAIIEGATEAERNARFVALSELEDYLIKQEHGLADTMALAGLAYQVGQQFAYAEMKGGRAQLALVLDLVRAKLKALK